MPQLFRLTKQFVPDYGRADDAKETFYMSADIEKVKTFVKGQFGVDLDSNGRGSHYYSYDEGADEYLLETVEFTSLL